MADGREPQLFSTRKLYQLCVAAVVDRFHIYKQYLVDLPKSVRFDLYYQVKRSTSCRRCGDGYELTGGRESSHPHAMTVAGRFCVSPRRATGTGIVD